MSATRPLRAARVFQVVALVYNLGSCVHHAVIGSMVGMILGAARVVALAVAICWTTEKIGQREYLDRPRPDYAAIARMEREVYGETFKHEGSEQVRRAEIHAVARRNGLDAGAFETLVTEFGRPVRHAACPQSHPDHLWMEGRGQVCPQCDRQRDEHRSNLRWADRTDPLPSKDRP